MCCAVFVGTEGPRDVQEFQNNSRIFYKDIWMGGGGLSRTFEVKDSFLSSLSTQAKSLVLAT